MRSLYFIPVVFLLLTASLLSAAEQPPLKIASVDLDRVMSESIVIKTMIENIQADVKADQETVAAKLTKYKVLKESYAKQQSILSRQEQRTRLSELDDLKMEIQDLKDKINRKIRRSDRDIVQPTLDRVQQAIRDMGKQYGYDLILRSDSVLFVSKRCDVTELVVQSIDNPETVKKPGHSKPENETNAKPKKNAGISPPVLTPIPTPTPGNSGITY